MKKRMNLITMFVFSVIALLQSCGKSVFCEDERLSWGKQKYIGVQIKTNGYYHGEEFRDDYKGIDYERIYYLFRDGVFFNDGSELKSKAQSGTIYIDTLNSLGKQTQYAWGVYKINNNTK
jgi:hypothetical protein